MFGVLGLAEFRLSPNVALKAVHVTFVFNLGKMFKLLNAERSMYKMAQRLNTCMAQVINGTFGYRCLFQGSWIFDPGVVGL